MEKVLNAEEIKNKIKNLQERISFSNGRLIEKPLNEGRLSDGLRKMVVKSVLNHEIKDQKKREKKSPFSTHDQESEIRHLQQTPESVYFAKGNLRNKHLTKSGIYSEVYPSTKMGKFVSKYLTLKTAKPETDKPSTGK